METENKLDSPEKQKHEFGGSTRGRVLGGLIVVGVGIVLLARAAGADLPFWITKWPMILIIVGLYVGIRHSFRGPGWMIPLLIGTVFLINEIDPTLNFKEFILPAIVIIVGVALMVKPPRKRWRERRAMHRHQWENYMTSHETLSQEDSIDTVTIFGGVQKNVVSKNFKGGELVTIFGGTELNFSQADMQQKIVLDITQIFGGAKLVVPPHWRIQSEDIVSIFGGVEDKRSMSPNINYDENKVLILKGTNIFGGIDIKSF
jgi:predicted membrane protein